MLHLFYFYHRGLDSEHVFSERSLHVRNGLRNINLLLYQFLTVPPAVLILCHDQVNSL